MSPFRLQHSVIKYAEKTKWNKSKTSLLCWLSRIWTVSTPRLVTLLGLQVFSFCLLSPHPVHYRTYLPTKALVVALQINVVLSKVTTPNHTHVWEFLFEARTTKVSLCSHSPTGTECNCHLLNVSFLFDNCPNGSTSNFTVCTSYWLNLMSQIILFAVHVKQAQLMWLCKYR